MDYEIREMNMGDYENAIFLWKHTEGIELSGADGRDHISHFLEKNSGLCFCAYNGKSLIGTILCGEDGRRGYIYHLAVEKDFRKLGAGKELVKISLLALRKLGIQKCHLFVVADNYLGKHFWQHIGWELRDDIEVMSIEINHNSV